MKILLTAAISAFLLGSLTAQDFQYVNAFNGLLVRDAPDITASRLDKLPFAARVNVLENSGKAYTLLENGKKISGEWVKIKAYDDRRFRQITGYVFNAFLTQEKIFPLNRIDFGGLSLEMEHLELFDDLGPNGTDTLHFLLEPGESPETKRLRITRNIYRKIEILQRYETTVTIMDEGPHCDLIEWEHFYSEWEPLTYLPSINAYQVRQYSESESRKFIDVTPEELQRAVLQHCGERWAKLIPSDQSVGTYPSGIDISRIFLKLVLTDQDGQVSEKLLIFELPMGC
ncbi:SH3 domain-containing protein [Flavilitoribacter nigricans]|uniref:SH3b domain-containing protein n=1 Tax=Flavilitoribacter nigricans (strain ATCC 23147 / DSM 23189 / NBRC 102662 / NCIMB 1420 / SS-2) TaxID=1122177 RepID=A0A2D0NIQ2_FLAN2|nr:SH3 domain-containing protein [Flavilitoribacter nigricans]PHN08270.1 hypothetical protein CRP01_02815 [Flavilitoribacter nigricans DSM 23189 = NBRC 102662]